MAVGAQATRRLWQYRQQGRFGAGQLLWRLAQIRPTGGGYALQRATKRRAIEVQVENLVFRQVPFQLRRAPQLTCLAGQRALMGVEQACNLHRQCAATRKHSPTAQVLPRRTAQRQWINARVLKEPTVFVSQQSLKVIRRHLTCLHRVAPHPIGIGKTP